MSVTIKQPSGLEKTGQENNDAGAPGRNRWRKVSRFKLVTITAVLFTGVVTGILFIQYSPNHQSSFKNASFSARKSTDNAIPNTVVFSYNIDDVAADSFFIQQSWDINRRVRIHKKNYTLTDIYYEPGYHIAKLIANDVVISTVDVSIPTDRWFLYARDGAPKSMPQYIGPKTPIIKNGVLALSPAALVANQIDAREVNRYVYTYYPGKMSVNSDNYRLKTRVRVQEIKNNHCPTLMVEVFGQRHFMFFKSTTKGCSSEAIVQFGEHYISGKQTDLSLLCYDVTEWVEVEIMVKEKNVAIYFDGKKVFTTSYVEPLGLITGLAFLSNGLIEIDHVALTGPDGAVVYQNDFSEVQ
jgi:hypothetical protein